VADRLETGYRAKLRWLLAKVRPRRLDFGVDLLVRRARTLSEREGVPLPEALARVYEFTRWRVKRRLERTAACRLTGTPLDTPVRPPRFLCDPSLGGLARWLRAAGYEADWLRSSSSADPLGEARRRGAILVTTDSRQAGRMGPEGMPEILWVPSSLRRVHQLGVVLRDLDLEPREPRCMACGAELKAVPKHEVAARIPPRTARWKDDYFVCAGCGRLYWQGTHWQRIAAGLQGERPSPSAAARP
jgi:uncharacterized protein with PIN domain